MKAIPYLQLDQIKHNIQVEKSLPPDVAWHYHALPVSFDGQRMTVAISAPEDAEVWTVVSSMFRWPVSFVRADLYAIDHRLAEIWHANQDPAARLLLWSDDSPQRQPLHAYSDKLAGLLNASLYQCKQPLEAKQLDCSLSIACEEFHPDLLIFDRPDEIAPKQRLARRISKKQLSKLPVSTLFANDLRWPIRKVLLVLSDRQPGSDLSVEWAGKFAAPGRAEVIVLPVLPPVPLMYGASLHYTIPGLLKANDPLGRTARRIADHFSDLGVKSTFRLRDGDPLHQLRSEVAAADPDLIILALGSARLADSLLSVDLTRMLLEEAGSPILIAKNC